MPPTTRRMSRLSPQPEVQSPPEQIAGRAAAADAKVPVKGKDDGAIPEPIAAAPTPEIPAVEDSRADVKAEVEVEADADAKPAPEEEPEEHVNDSMSEMDIDEVTAALHRDDSDDEVIEFGDAPDEGEDEDAYGEGELGVDADTREEFESVDGVSGMDDDDEGDGVSGTENENGEGGSTPGDIDDIIKEGFENEDSEPDADDADLKTTKITTTTTTKKETNVVKKAVQSKRVASPEAPEEYSDEELGFVDEKDLEPVKGVPKDKKGDKIAITNRDAPPVSAATATPTRSPVPSPNAIPVQSASPKDKKEQKPKVTYRCANAKPLLEPLRNRDGRLILDRLGREQMVRPKDEFGEYLSCGAFTERAIGESLICAGCGSRVLEKVRTKRMIQFEAR